MTVGSTWGVPGRCVKTLQSEIYIRFAHMVRGNVSWMMWFAETYTWYTLTWNTWFQHAADLLWLISHRDYLPTGPGCCVLSWGSG